MSANHANVHVVEQAPARPRAAHVEVRDHREAKPQPIALVPGDFENRESRHQSAASNTGSFCPRVKPPP